MNAALAAELHDVPVVYENQADSDGRAVYPEGQTHAEAWLLPGDAFTVEIGSKGKQRAVGVYQVTVRTPLRTGKWEANTIRDRVLGVFGRGDHYTHGATTVRVVSSHPGSGAEEPPYFSVPVTINWQADF